MTMHDAVTALDPDAQAVADQLAAALPGGLSGLGVAGVREFGRLSDAQSPPPPAVHSVTDHQVTGPHGPIGVRVYRPEATVPVPVLLYLHGGGWTFGTLDGVVDHLCRSISVAADIAVVSVDYHLAPEFKFPVPIDDAMAVLAWLREQAGRLGVDPARTAIGGDSAGANISAAVTHLDRGGEQPLAAQVLIYPATEYAVERPSWIDNADAPVLTVRDTLWFWDQYLRGEADRTDPRATPANSPAFTGLPRALVVVAGRDPLRDDGLQYADLLKDAGTPTQILRLDGTFHGFMTMPGLQSQARGVAAVVAFLADTLADVGVKP
jgi:acetyl esterase